MYKSVQQSNMIYKQNAILSSTYRSEFAHFVFMCSMLSLEENKIQSAGYAIVYIILRPKLLLKFFIIKSVISATLLTVNNYTPQ
jgi:hypothetical protein